jgi:hypothetical protein
MTQQLLCKPAVKLFTRNSQLIIDAAFANSAQLRLET